MSLWDGVVPLLADRFRIVRYDNRGVGKTSVPKPVSAYTMACYADDFAAVIDAFAPGEPVHVLAHDWGSAGMWEYLSRPGASDRVARSRRCPARVPITSNRLHHRQPQRPYRPRRFLQALEPVAAVVLHGLCSPYPCWRRSSCASSSPMAHARADASRDGIPAEQLHHSETYRADAVNSTEGLPRQLLPRDSLGRGPTTTSTFPCSSSSIPRIRICGRYVYDDTKNWVPRLWRRDIKAGHWSPMSHPRVLAQSVARVRRPSRRQAREPGAAARAGRSSARILRRHTGFRDRRGQRHRPRDRAGVRPRGRRSGDQRHRRGQRQGDRRADHRPRRGRARLHP